MKRAISRFVIFTLSIIVFTAFGGFSPQMRDDVPAYKNPKLPVEERVEDLLNRMTLKEKIAMLSGAGFRINETKAIPSLGIPSLKMTDGAVGVNWGKSTAFPAGTCMAASWDTSMIYRVGKAIAQEVKGKGRDVLLGPNVNIARIPLDGRTFEAYGEDPYLTSRMAVSYIEGVQSQGVAATVKHFDANNQEYERLFVNEKVGKRALNEIYMPAFKAAVKQAHVMALMAAYNKVNGSYCTQNNYLLEKKLLHDWGFKGLIMSDWGAVHSSIPVANGGMDLEMPTGIYLNDSTLIPAIKSGKVKISTINDKVKRILRVMFKLGLFDHALKPDPALINTPEHREVAYRAAVEGIVLLKNTRHILPLDIGKVKSIAVIGPDAAVDRATGGGSAHVNPIYSVSPLEGLERRLGGKISLNFAQGVQLAGDASSGDSSYFYLPNENAHGLRAEYFDNGNLSGQPRVTRVDEEIDFKWRGGSPAAGVQGKEFSVRWTGRLRIPETGEYFFHMMSRGGVRLYIDGKLLIDNWSGRHIKSDSEPLRLDKDRFYNIKLEYSRSKNGSEVTLGLRKSRQWMLRNAVSAAKKSDVAILFVGTSAYYERENHDRPNLRLPAHQDELIKAVTNANKNTIVVLITGGPVSMDGWIKEVPGLVQAWFGGDEGGDAIADVLLGKYDPSGKLPITFPVKWSDCSAYGTYKHKDSVSVYNDGIFVGYRWFDEHHIKPLFPFGYGLTYTNFSFSDLKITRMGEDYGVSFNIRNTGKVSGVEIPQLYVHDPDKAVVSPMKELKRFDRVMLTPGETTTVRFMLKKSDFAHYYPSRHGWYTHPGKYDVLIGSSSRDILLRGSLRFN